METQLIKECKVPLDFLEKVEQGESFILQLIKEVNISSLNAIILTGSTDENFYNAVQRHTQRNIKYKMKNLDACVECKLTDKTLEQYLFIKPNPLIMSAFDPEREPNPEEARRFKSKAQFIIYHEIGHLICNERIFYPCNIDISKESNLGFILWSEYFAERFALSFYHRINETEFSLLPAAFNFDYPAMGSEDYTLAYRSLPEYAAYFHHHGNKVDYNNHKIQELPLEIQEDFKKLSDKLQNVYETYTHEQLPDQVANDTRTLLIP